MPDDTTAGPDIAAIETILTAVEAGHSAGGVDPDRRDREYSVLTRVQAEVTDLVMSEGREGRDDDRESLRRLLERINDAIDANRSARDR